MGQSVTGKYRSVVVFSATKMNDRESLGQKVSTWIASMKPEIVETVVSQSSDSEFHCLSIVIFFN